MKNFLLHPDAMRHLSGAKLLDGKFDPKLLASLPLPAGAPPRVKIIVKPLAWLKMDTLIRTFTTEVGWQGICYRDSESDTTFHLDDVMVYPQKVTGTNITTDETRHGEWLDSFADEDFFRIRFHGHSHVNMAVFSSGTDDDLQRDLISMMNKPDDFYLFFIMNKRGEVFIRLYDNKHMVTYETKDVDLEIKDDTFDLAQFVSGAKAQVTTVVPTYLPTQYQYGKGATPPKQTTPSSLPPAKPSAPAAPAPAEEKESNNEYDYDLPDWEGDDEPTGWWDGRTWHNLGGRGFAQ